MRGYTKMKSSRHIESRDFDEANGKTTPEGDVETYHTPSWTKNGDASAAEVGNNRPSSSSSPPSDAFKLHRNFSVSSSAPSKSMQQHVSIVKRAFSLGRSSSVSERYRRIHDKGVALEQDDDHETTPSKKAGKSKRIFRACKRIFRL